MLRNTKTKILLILAIVFGCIISYPTSALSITVASPEQETNIEVVGCTDRMDIQTYAKCRVTEKWGVDHFEAFDNIIKHESGWCHTKWNGQVDCPDVAREVRIPGRSGAQGLCQTMLSVHGLKTDYDFMNNPYRQLDWCITYAANGNHGNMPFRNPIEAWEYWKVNRYW